MSKLDEIMTCQDAVIKAAIAFDASCKDLDDFNLGGYKKYSVPKCTAAYTVLQKAKNSAENNLRRAVRALQASGTFGGGEPPHPTDCPGCPDCRPIMGDATYTAMMKSGAL